MDTNMEITIEFLAGTSIEDAAMEAKEKVISWNVAFVKFKFNGISISISRNADIDHVVKMYHKNLTYIVS